MNLEASINFRKLSQSQTMLFWDRNGLWDKARFSVYEQWDVSISFVILLTYKLLLTLLSNLNVIALLKLQISQILRRERNWKHARYMRRSEN